MTQSQIASQCETSSSLSCEFTDDEGGVCEDLRNEKGKDCRIRPISVEYKFCNDNDVEINLIWKTRDKKTNPRNPVETFFKYKDEYLDINYNPLPLAPKTCFVKTIERDLDTCSSTVFSLQLQGYLKGKDNQDEGWCREYEYKQIRLVPVCTVMAEVSCYYTDADSLGYACEDFIHKHINNSIKSDDNPCTERNVEITYKITSTNKRNDIELLKELTIPKFQGDELEFEKFSLGNGETMQITHIKTMSNCDTKKFVMSLKVEGWIKGFKDKPFAESTYCFDWAFSEVKLEKPVIELSTKCFHRKYGSNDEWSKCENTRITSLDSCMRELKYKYTIKN